MSEQVWTRAMFSLVTPDAIRRHLLRPIVTRLRDEGLAVAAFRVTELTPVDMDGMYEAHLVNSADAYRYRALDARMTLGPSIALRLRPPDDGLPIETWYARLKQIKGASAPGMAEPGSIRCELRATNTILSLLHCSDTPEFASREAELMLGGPMHTLSWQDGSVLDPVVDMLQAMQVKETRGFCEVLTEVRASIAMQLWDVLDDDGRALTAKLVTASALCAAGAGEQVCAQLPHDIRQQSLARILAHPFDPSSPAMDIGWVHRHLYGAGISLDRWSQAVLGSSMYFAPLRNGDR